MKVKILFRVVMVTCVVVLQSGPSYCAMDILRSSAKSKIQPLFLNMSYHEETKVTTYYGRFGGPSDLVVNSVGTLRKVSDVKHSSEFEVIAQFPADEYFRILILRSECASEVLEIDLSDDPANHVQTTFSGARCPFEVKRSKEGDTEEYTCVVKDCGLDRDFMISQYFGGDIKKDGNVDNFLGMLSKSEIKEYGKYLNTTHRTLLPSYDEESKLTLNKFTMTEDNVQLKPLYFHVYPFLRHDRQKVASILVWKFNII